MIKKRVIPTLSYKDYGLVKSKKFTDYRMIGDPIQAIKVYNLRDVDEIFFVDISENMKKPNENLIQDILQYAFMPVTVGGGISSIEDIRTLLSVGADKVALSWKAFYDTNFVSQAVDTFGAQAIVVSIDYFFKNNDFYLVFNPGFRIEKVNILKYVETLSSVGVSEIVLTSVERDGEMCGYDLELVKKVEDKTHVGVVLNGGAGVYEHMLDAFKTTQSIVGVAASSMFHFTEQTPKGASKFLKTHDIRVRV